MKILYLDIDGVLLPLYKNNGFFNYKTHKLEKFPPSCVNALNYILTETNCEIVISSDWRKHFSLEELQEIFTINKIIKLPIGVTDITINNDIGYNKTTQITERVDEINKSVKLHKPEKWISVDDLQLDKLENFIWCKKYNFEGISQLGIKEKIIKILNNK